MQQDDLIYPKLQALISEIEQDYSHIRQATWLMGQQSGKTLAARKVAANLLREIEDLDYTNINPHITFVTIQQNGIHNSALGAYEALKDLTPQKLQIANAEQVSLGKYGYCHTAELENGVVLEVTTPHRIFLRGKTRIFATLENCEFWNTLDNKVGAFETYQMLYVSMESLGRMSATKPIIIAESSVGDCTINTINKEFEPEQQVSLPSWCVSPNVEDKSSMYKGAEYESYMRDFGCQ